MPEIRTDDGPVWLGPRGITLPVQWTYHRWVGFMVAGSVIGPTLLVVLSVLTYPWFGMLVSVVAGIPLAAWVSGRVDRAITSDSSPGHLLVVAQGAWARFRAPVEDPQRLVMTQPVINDLGPGARRAL